MSVKYHTITSLLELKPGDHIRVPGYYYNVFSNNCEHLVNWAKIGVHKSNQVDGAVRTAVIVVCACALIYLVWKYMDEQRKEETSSTTRFSTSPHSGAILSELMILIRCI